MAATQADTIFIDRCNILADGPALGVLAVAVFLLVVSVVLSVLLVTANARVRRSRQVIASCNQRYVLQLTVSSRECKMLKEQLQAALHSALRAKMEAKRKTRRKDASMQRHGSRERHNDGRNNPEPLTPTTTSNKSGYSASNSDISEWIDTIQRSGAFDLEVIAEEDPYAPPVTRIVEERLETVRNNRRMANINSKSTDRTDEGMKREIERLLRAVNQTAEEIESESVLDLQRMEREIVSPSRISIASALPATRGGPQRAESPLHSDLSTGRLGVLRGFSLRRARGFNQKSSSNELDTSVV